MQSQKATDKLQTPWFLRIFTTPLWWKNSSRYNSVIKPHKYLWTTYVWLIEVCQRPASEVQSKKMSKVKCVCNLFTVFVLFSWATIFRFFFISGRSLLSCLHYFPIWCCTICRGRRTLRVPFRYDTKLKTWEFTDRGFICWIWKSQPAKESVVQSLSVCSTVS